MILRTSIGLVTLFVVGPVIAQAPKPRPDYFKDNVLDNTCLRCHAAPRDADKERAAKFVLLRESEYWEKHDLHRRAFDALSSPLGKTMSKQLYGDEAKAAVTPACLVCHATDTRPETPLAKKTPEQFLCQYGVNCQACHGPGQEWAFRHIDDQVWREKHPKEKAEFGQVNLRNPTVRAEKCVSCHVGSKDESKFVTHDMYVAGHPPLPAFELASFSRDEPMHWRSAAMVKHIAELNTDKAKELFSYRKGENEAARLAAVGAVVSLRESVKLLTFDPDDKKPLDFAHFNCSVCHHELRVPTNRQPAGVPGRPVPTTWPTWLTRAVLQQTNAADTETGKKFTTSYAELRKAFDAVPFGNRVVVVQRVKEVRIACDELLAVIDRTEITEANAVGMIREIKGGRDYLDADAATHLARAAGAILSHPKLDLEGKPPETAPTFESSAGLKQLHQLLGLAVRDTYRNADLLQANGVFGKRSQRAAEYEANPKIVRDALRELAKPSSGPPR